MSRARQFVLLCILALVVTGVAVTYCAPPDGPPGYRPDPTSTARP